MKTYTTPVAVVVGSAVRETMSGSPSIFEQTPLKRPDVGTVGYYL